MTERDLFDIPGAAKTAAPFWDDDIMNLDQRHEDWSFIYQQSTGEFGIGYTERMASDCHFHHRLVLATGYSGRGATEQNNPSAQHIIGKGPIPRGDWILGDAITHKTLGPFAIPLHWNTNGEYGPSIPGGRSGFYIHGDNQYGNRTASSGCIILDNPVRRMIDYLHKQKPVSRRLYVIA